MIEYSIIIPSYHSDRTIGDCLDALVKQADLERGEIIVVNSGQGDTPRLVKDRFPQVKLIHHDERKSAGQARNLGIEAARGKLFLFIDADCVAAPDWVSRMTAAHRDGRHAGVGGAIVNGNPQGLASWAGYFLEFSPFIPGRSLKKREVGHVPTCNVSYPGSAFDEQGGFPAHMYPVEDRVFNEKLTRKGKAILFDPAIQVRHFHRADLASLLRHQVTIGRGSAGMRQQFETKSVLAQSPYLLFAVLPLLFLGRLAFFIKRLPAYPLKMTGLWLLSLPLYLLGIIWWLAGFARGVCRKDSVWPDLDHRT